MANKKATKKATKKGKVSVSYRGASMLDVVRYVPRGDSKTL